jgi:hypothetical protein
MLLLPSRIDLSRPFLTRIVRLLILQRPTAEIKTESGQGMANTPHHPNNRTYLAYLQGDNSYMDERTNTPWQNGPSGTERENRASCERLQRARRKVALRACPSSFPCNK